ncbi:MAG: protein kinase [Betaproteobacteria bacterium]|nr:protein kinase [Betaproteobacteria bacterium]
MDGYNAKSCNALEKPFYRPVEAALRWCGLIAHEDQILTSIGEDGIPKTGQFPQWPCLQANTEKILDAIMYGSIPHGRDGRSVAAGDHVAKARLTVRHNDLREWMAKHYPDQKPEFLFDETERQTHAVINADAFRALQADRDALRAKLDNEVEKLKTITTEREKLTGERDSLRAMVDKNVVPGDRAETTYLNTIAALLNLMLGKSPAGRKHSVFDSEAAIITAILAQHEGKPGISERTLESKFAAAKRSLTAT